MIEDAIEPRDVRAAIREGYGGPTLELAPGYVQANLVIVPSDTADDVADLCSRNPVACSVIERLAPGSYEPACAPGADLRTDLPQYRIYRKGLLLEKCTSIVDLWHTDFTAFLIGGSQTLDWALEAAGIEVRHRTERRSAPLYRTTLRLAPSGRLFGHMVVSMRPFKADDIERVRETTHPYHDAHGEPLFWGDPDGIGVRRLDLPDDGDPVKLERGDIPVFWGSGVTMQQTVIESRIPYAIVHEPGHMFVTDRSHEALSGGRTR